MRDRGAGRDLVLVVEREVPLGREVLEQVHDVVAVQQGKRFSAEQLIRIMDRLAEADYEMKMGKKDKALVLEMFFLQLQGA